MLNVDGEKLADLRFADDVVLIATSLKYMEVQLNELNKESKKIGSTFIREQLNI